MSAALQSNGEIVISGNPTHSNCGWWNGEDCDKKHVSSSIFEHISPLMLFFVGTVFFVFIFGVLLQLCEMLSVFNQTEPHSTTAGSSVPPSTTPMPMPINNPVSYPSSYQNNTQPILDYGYNQYIVDNPPLYHTAHTAAGNTVPPSTTPMQMPMTVYNPLFYPSPHHVNTQPLPNNGINPSVLGAPPPYTPTAPFSSK